MYKIHNSVTLIRKTVHLNIVGIWLKTNGSIFDDDVGNSAHLLRFIDGMIPLRHGTRGLLHKKKNFITTLFTLFLQTIWLIRFLIWFALFILGVVHLDKWDNFYM